MKTKVLTAGFLLALGMSAGVANAGCLKGAAIGGVGGHFVGHHGVLGAAAGCAVGHFRAKKEKRMVPASNSTK